MNKEFDRDNIKNSRMELNRICAKRIDKVPNDNQFIVKRSDKYEILELKNNLFTLKLISKVFIEPEAFFNIDIEYKVNFEFSHKVDKKFIDKNVDELLNPIGGEMSYIISTLTKALTDDYLVMPPMISIDRDEKKSKK